MCSGIGCKSGLVSHECPVCHFEYCTECTRLTGKLCSNCEPPSLVEIAGMNKDL